MTTLFSQFAQIHPQYFSEAVTISTQSSNAFIRVAKIMLLRTVHDFN
jgi:hypothetical protein